GDLGGMTGPPLGAIVMPGNRCTFRVWAPLIDRVELQLVAPSKRRVPLTKTGDGYHEAIVDDVGDGAQYLFSVGGGERPDPASRLQPHGVHGPSEVVGRDFAWHDGGWRGIALEDFVLYELHVGTFTEAGTFDAAIERLD